MCSLDNQEWVVVKGAPQVILKLCEEENHNEEIFKKIEEFAENGFRTLGVAYKKPEEKAFKFIGLIPLFNPPREDSKKAIEMAQSYNVEIKMLTGDNLAIAKYISRILG